MPPLKKRCKYHKTFLELIMLFLDMDIECRVYNGAFKIAPTSNAEHINIIFILDNNGKYKKIESNKWGIFIGSLREKNTASKELYNRLENVKGNSGLNARMLRDSRIVTYDNFERLHDAELILEDRLV